MRPVWLPIPRSCSRPLLPRIPRSLYGLLNSLGRAVTSEDFEVLTLASAHNALKATATDYVAAQFDAFQISRASRFMESCDVFLSPTLCSPPLRIGEINTMLDDLSHIAPLLRRYMPGTSMSNISGQPQCRFLWRGVSLDCHSV